MNPIENCADIDALLFELDRDPVKRQRETVTQLENRLVDVTSHDLYPAAARAVPFLAELAIHSPFTCTRLDALHLLMLIAECLPHSLRVLTPDCIDNDVYVALQKQKALLEHLAESADADDPQLGTAVTDIVQLLNWPHTPCPRCGQKLATPLAQQCLHCNADWHVRAT